LSLAASLKYKEKCHKPDETCFHIFSDELGLRHSNLWIIFRKKSVRKILVVSQFVNNFLTAQESFRIFVVKSEGMAKIQRFRDPNQKAKQIVDLLTGEITEVNPDEGKNPAAVSLGRLGGLKGGKARAEKLTPERRKEIAQLGAKKRWKGK